MEVVRQKITANKTAILDDLDLNKDMLALLSKKQVLDITDCVKLQQTENVSERNMAFIEMILTREDDSVYTCLIECLQQTGQDTVLSLLLDVSSEMLILSQMQNQMETQLKQMADFLATEERRAGIYLTETQDDGDDGTPAVTEQQVWGKVQDTLKRCQQQLTRCRSVIKKLHEDCEMVAKQNADIVEHTKECDAKIKAVLTVGRHSAKQKSVPKKTQDLFANLMDDIEKLVKSRRKVLDKETEGRRHSTRIVRQCRDWVESRSVALQKLAGTPAPGAFRSFEAPGDSELIVNIRKAAPRANDNSILSVLDSLQLLEQELQEYIHREITVTDKYRSELRHKHLLKRVHGFSIHGISDVESALESLEKEPDNLKDNLVIVKTCVSEINREYGECVSFLSRVEPGGAADSDSNTSGGQTSRRDPKQTRKTANLGGKFTRTLENSLNALNRGTERNQLLERIKAFVVRHEELKSEDQVVGNKYRAEMSKKKRETDILIQRKDDQILRLQTEIKEAIAEKEKYKKLYNDTKIGYQRNHENARAWDS